MEQRYEANRQTGLWLERLVWNAAAGAVLAVMILLLLESLRWLDAIAPEPTDISVTVDAAGPVADRVPASVPGEGAAPAEALATALPERSTEVAEFNRPGP